MMDAVLRTATPDDRVAMTAIYNDAVVHSVATFDLEPRDEDHYVPHLTSTRPGDHVVVAEAGGRVVGFAHSGTYRPRPAYDGTREVSIYLDEGVRGTAIVTKLGLVTEVVATLAIGGALLFGGGELAPLSTLWSRETPGGVAGVPALLAASLAMAWIFFGFASSRLGRVTCSRPSLNSALIEAWSTTVGSVNERLNAPYERSTRW